MRKMVDIEKIKKLREETGISISECRKALEESEGDVEKAKEILQRMGKEFAQKKSGEEVKEGIIDSYIHANKKVGVLLEIRCQTDFVARSKEFQNLSHEICLQIAAMRPIYVKGEDIPEDVLDQKKNVFRKEFENSGKDKDLIERIVSNKIEDYKKEVCLLNQPWIKDNSKTIKDLLEEHIRLFGENIKIRRFIRYEI